jgi:hypothetical protein
MELQLRMQQQQERATRPAPDAAAETQRRQFEVEQQQHLQQFNDTQSRAAASQLRRPTIDDVPADPMRRVESPPRVNTDRSIAGSR